MDDKTLWIINIIAYIVLFYFVKTREKQENLARETINGMKEDISANSQGIVDLKVEVGKSQVENLNIKRDMRELKETVNKIHDILINKKD